MRAVINFQTDIWKPDWNSLFSDINFFYVVLILIPVIFKKKANFHLNFKKQFPSSVYQTLNDLAEVFFQTLGRFRFHSLEHFYR